MIKLILFFLTCLFISLTSCEEIRHKSRDFQYIEELMPHHPDSALALLNQINDTEVLSRKDKAHYYLLWTEAQDKTYATHTTDSFITVATNYYEETKDLERKAKAWFYKGRINQEIHCPLKAQEYYLKALRNEDEINDYALLGKINNNIGMLYTYQMVYEKALPFHKKAIENFRMSRDSTGQVFALRDLARTFLMLGYRDSAIISNQKATSLMKKNILPSVYTELAHLYLGEQRIKEAYELLQIALQNTIRPQAKYPIYLVLGSLLQQRNQIDSACFYLQVCADSAPLPATRAGGLFQLKEIALTQKQWKQAALLSKQYASLRDSIDKMQQTESIRKTQAFYSYTTIEQELLKTKLYTSNLKFKYSLFIISCLIILFGLVLYFTRYIREKRLLLQRLKENEQQIYKNEQTIQELSFIKEDLQRDIFTYQDNQKKQTQKNEQLENLSRLKERLEQELITLKTENFKLKNWKKEKEDGLKVLKIQQWCNRFHSPIGWEPTEKDWNTLFSFIEESNPTFAIALQKAVHLNDSEKKICYLSKIGVKPSAVAILLHLENVSVYRKRLYEKLTGLHGTAKDFDKYISSL